MKKQVIIVGIFFLVVTFSYAKGLRLGLQASPLVSWMKPDKSFTSKESIGLGYSYGLIVDLDFTDNYSFGTGINLTHQRGNIRYDSAFTLRSLSTIDTLSGSMKTKLQFLEIPLTIKLKSNEVGYMRFFGQFGLTPGITLKAFGDVFSHNVTGQNITKDINFMNIAMTLGAGVEYSLGGKTSLIGALMFNNGFIDVTRKNKSLIANSAYSDTKVILNNFTLRIGILF